MILDDSQLRDYQTKLADLRRTLAESMPPLTDAHPKIQKLKAQIRELEGEMAVKKTNVLDRMRNEFQASRQREQLLLAAYHGQEGRVAQELSHETQMNMLRRDVESGQQLYQTLSQRVKEAGLVSAMQATTIRVVDAALTPVLPIVPRRVRSMALGLILGAVVGICFAFFKERTETVLRTPGESPRYLNIRELGVIPSARVGLSKVYVKQLAQTSVAGLIAESASGLNDSQSKTDQVVDLATWKAHASLVAEAYRSTTYSILLENKQSERGKSYVISSPSAGEGKTTVTCNLGIALAQANRRVLVIDGDLRRPRLHKSMGIANERGLREVLRGDIDFENTTIDQFCQPSQVPNMFILPSGSGTEEPGSLLYSPRLRPLLDRLIKEFDVVLMDTPPVLHLADARILAGVTDGVILVLRARSTDREAAMNARDLFHHDQVRIMGTILNDFDPLSQGRLDYYDSYYKYANAAGELRGA
jgi:capsular exopolysaccharide synthesis family protein